MSAESRVFVVQSGDGYLIELTIDETPHLTSDPLEAARYPEGMAREIAAKLDTLGYEAKVVEYDPQGGQEA